MKFFDPSNSLMVWCAQRPLRERVLLLVCLFAVLFFIWDAAVMSSFDLRKKRALNQARQLQLELDDLTTRKELVEMRKDFDPDRENRQVLKQLKEQIAESGQQLEEGVVKLISPQKMPELLKDLLGRKKKLKLLSLENLPAEALQINEQVAEEQLSPLLYRHRLNLEFAGDYLATLAYLKELESLPRQMVWERLQIETQEYPQAKVRLQVYTLSLTKGWIGG